MVVIVNKACDIGEEGGAKCGAFFLYSLGRTPSKQAGIAATHYQYSVAVVYRRLILAEPICRKRFSCSEEVPLWPYQSFQPFADMYTLF